MYTEQEVQAKAIALEQRIKTIDLQQQRVQDQRDLLQETIACALVTLLHDAGAHSVLPNALLTAVHDLRGITGRDPVTGRR